MEHVEIAVIGAGASGLGVAAALQRRGRRPVVLDRDDFVGGTWERRYERLRLHTARRFSGLPFHPIPRKFGAYVQKDCYARYLQQYVENMNLDVRLGRSVQRIRREDGDWVVTTRQDEWRARAVVVATGRHNQMRLPDWPGTECFGGQLLHSADYRSGREFANLNVLVVGIGNSGAEIAVDLVEQGASHVSIAVRSSPPISSREVFGIPVQVLGILLMPFPTRAVDRAGAALRRIGNGDLSRFGLGPPAWEPFSAKRPAVIDVGFVKQLKDGNITVLPGLARFTPDGVTFIDGRQEKFDVVVAATGYTSGLSDLLGTLDVLDDRGFPHERSTHPPGLFFAGYSETPRGQLFESSHASRGLAKAIDRHLKEPS